MGDMSRKIIARIENVYVRNTRCRGQEVSCDWWRAAHVTPALALIGGEVRGVNTSDLT